MTTQTQNKQGAAGEAATVRVPLIFWSDHEDRDLPTPQPTHRYGAHVVIPLYGAETDELLSDAEHYAHRDGPGSVGLKSSARATVKAIKDARGTKPTFAGECDKVVNPPWKVMGHPLLADRHPFHENRYIVTADAVAEVTNPEPDVRNANDWDAAWELRNGVIIAEMTDSMRQKGTAAFIVRACNSHEALINVAERVLKYSESLKHQYGVSGELAGLTEQARAALAQAKEPRT